jgi:hypothetical protein
MDVAFRWPDQVRTVRRTDAIDEVAPGLGTRMERLGFLAARGLAAAYDPASDTFPQTVRAIREQGGIQLQREGSSLRYAAIAALGLNRLPVDQQREVLGGLDADELAGLTVRRAQLSDDVGAIALAVWAAAETGTYARHLVARLRAALTEGQPLATMEAAWALTAAVKADRLGDTDDIVTAAVALLTSHDGPAYPHTLPASAGPRWRAHVGSFADQVYPLQAFALASTLTGERGLLERANRIAATIVAAQGDAGQWWWHYDARDGSVVERYPVYSVHQHAMAPMALFDLRDAGGADHRDAIARGAGWVLSHPETLDELISERYALVWRKVGRREPPKAARAAGALTTSLHPGLHVPGIDLVLPPGRIDHECRPYELGWLLYAWLPQAAETGIGR